MKQHSFFIQNKYFNLKIKNKKQNLFLILYLKIYFLTFKKVFKKEKKYLQFRHKKKHKNKKRKTNKKKDQKNSRTSLFMLGSPGNIVLPVLALTQLKTCTIQLELVTIFVLKSLLSGLLRLSASESNGGRSKTKYLLLG